jgi:hypothetical protein
MSIVSGETGESEISLSSGVFRLCLSARLIASILRFQGYSAIVSADSCSSNRFAGEWR